MHHPDCVVSQEGYSAGFERAVEEVVAELTRTTYPLSALMERPLPDGVDPVRLEAYLSDDEFRVRRATQSLNRKNETSDLSTCPRGHFRS